MESRALFSTEVDKKAALMWYRFPINFISSFAQSRTMPRSKKSIFSSVNDVVYIHITTELVAVVKRVVVQTCDANFG